MCCAPCRPASTWCRPTSSCSRSTARSCGRPRASTACSCASRARWRASCRSSACSRSRWPAQALGYAEADPTDDVTGKDAAAKMAILARTPFSTPVHLDQVRYEGIEQLTSDDMAYARELGLGLKLIGTAERIGGGINVRVH